VLHATRRMLCQVEATRRLRLDLTMVASPVALGAAFWKSDRAENKLRNSHSRPNDDRNRSSVRHLKDDYAVEPGRHLRRRGDEKPNAPNTRSSLDKRHHVNGERHEFQRRSENQIPWVDYERIPLRNKRFFASALLNPTLVTLFFGIDCGDTRSARYGEPVSKSNVDRCFLNVLQPNWDDCEHAFGVRLHC